MAEVTAVSTPTEPNQAVADSTNAPKPNPPSSTSPKTDGVNDATSHADTAWTTSASAQTLVAENNNSSSRSGASKNQHRSPPKFDAATENNIRDMMGKVRKSAGGNDNPFQSEEDVKALAVLANNLVQLLNASYVVSMLPFHTELELPLTFTSAQATDTIIRGAAYIQGENRPHPKTAMMYAKRDRRAYLATQRAVDQAVTDDTNRDSAEPGTQDPAAALNASNGADENTAPGPEVQQSSVARQDKSAKKKRFWQNRRNHNRKNKNNADPKTMEGVAAEQEHGGVNGAGKAENEHGNKEETGSNAIVEETAAAGAGKGVAIAATA